MSEQDSPPRDLDSFRKWYLLRVPDASEAEVVQFFLNDVQGIPVELKGEREG